MNDNLGKGDMYERIRKNSIPVAVEHNIKMKCKFDSLKDMKSALE